MGPGTSSRARVPITILFTLLIVLGEFGFLQVVYHLDDHVERAARGAGAGLRRAQHLAAGRRHRRRRGGRARPGHDRPRRRTPACRP